MSEAALRLEFKDGDDDGGENPPVDSFDIVIVNNGFILTTTYEDGDEAKEVFHTIDEVFVAIQEAF